MTLINKQQVISHYTSIWGREYRCLKWHRGPFQALGKGFSVLEFPPREGKTMWTYATCGMCNAEDENPIELHLFSSDRDESLVELLTLVAHFHQYGEKLDLGHTVNFGRPWKPNSLCSYGIISLPYLDGLRLELFTMDDKKITHFYWLIPITKSEVYFKKEHRIETLEEIFESQDFNYIDPQRKSVV